MLSVSENGSIGLTRGDTARFNVSIKNGITLEDYEIQPNDVLVMTIKKKVKDKEPLIQKTITGASVFHILPTDTQPLDFGRYVYDVQITTSNSDVYTVIGPCSFEVMREVTY